MSVRIFLDAGHGGKDSGATYGKRRESDDVLRLVKAIGRKLESTYSNVCVGYSRTSDIYESPSKKAADANAFGATYFFSFHRNSSNGKAKGWEALYKSQSARKDDVRYDLAAKMQQIGFVIREDKQRNDLAVLNQTKMPALLFEIGFIDNVSDNKIFDQKFDQIVDAFVDTFGRRCGLTKIKKDKKKGCFSNNKNADNLSEFLHNRGYGAGEHNLRLIATANCESKEVKDALFELAKKGNLRKPDGLNCWDGK